MALALRKNNNARVGLDLDGAFLAAVQTTGDDVDALSDAIKSFFKEHQLPKRVRLGVSNQQIVVRQLDLPKIEDEAERTAAVRFQAAEAIAMPLEEVVLDHQVIGETMSPEGSARQRVVVVAAREAMISRVIEAVRGAGLKAEAIDLDAFALVRALATASAPDDSARVYCHLAGITNLAIALGSSCLFTRPLSTSWDEQDESVANALAEEIRLSIDFYMAQPEARWVGEVVLSGPGSRRDGLVDELSGLLQLPVSIAEPLGNLDAAKLPLGEDPYRHTVAAGLALGAAA